MHCPKCGKDIEDSKFCPDCGQAVDGPVALPENSTDGCVKVNKIAYALLGIFLGSLGIHRFYAKKYISGIIYILFCWTCIPGILGIIEGILALVKDDDGNGNLIVDPNSFFI